MSAQARPNLPKSMSQLQQENEASRLPINRLTPGSKARRTADDDKPKGPTGRMQEGDASPQVRPHAAPGDDDDIPLAKRLAMQRKVGLKVKSLKVKSWHSFLLPFVHTN